VDGLVHISDMSWTRRISHPSEVVQKGQEVNAVVTAIDPVKQRISLSMKELMPNEWEEYANKHGVGNLVSGSVTNITDFGVFIELAPGVEGLCHISEIDRDGVETLAEVFSPGQKVRCRILRIDWNENRIGLSMNSVSQSDAEEEFEGAGESAGVADTAMAAALKAGGIVVESEEADASEEDVSEEAVETASEETVEESEDLIEDEVAADDAPEAVAEDAVEEEGPEVETETAQEAEEAGTEPSEEASDEPVAEETEESGEEGDGDAEESK